MLGKPLGVGVVSAALKRGELDSEAYAQMLATTTKLNTPGPRLGDIEELMALTDLTGFGLVGPPSRARASWS